MEEQARMFIDVRPPPDARNGDCWICRGEMRTWRDGAWNPPWKPSDDMPPGYPKAGPRKGSHRKKSKEEAGPVKFVACCDYCKGQWIISSKRKPSEDMGYCPACQPDRDVSMPLKYWLATEQEIQMLKVSNEIQKTIDEMWSEIDSPAA